MRIHAFTLAVFSHLAFSASSAHAHPSHRDLLEAVSATCDKLSETLKKGKSTNNRVAIQVRINNEAAQLAKFHVNVEEIINLVIGRVESRHVTLFPLPKSDDPSRTSIPELARQQGADFLLTFITSHSETQSILNTRLTRVDKGLWHPTTSPNPIVFYDSVAFQKPTKPYVASSPSKSGIQKLRSIEGNIVALSNCDILTESPGEELIILTSSELLLFGQRKSFIRLLGRFKLSEIMAGKIVRSRYPHGFAYCRASANDSRQVIFSMSDYQGTASLRFENSVLSDPQLELVSNEPRISTLDETRSLKYAPGRPWFIINDIGDSLPPRTFFEFSFPSPQKTYGVAEDYTVRVVSAAGAATHPKITSGLGFSAFASSDGSTQFVTTSSIANAAGTDHVKIRTADGVLLSFVELRGRVKASTVLRDQTTKSMRIILAVSKDSKNRTQLYELKVSE